MVTEQIWGRTRQTIFFLTVGVAPVDFVTSGATYEWGIVSFAPT
jgi:hypothetical protein